ERGRKIFDPGDPLLTEVVANNEVRQTIQIGSVVDVVTGKNRKGSEKQTESEQNVGWTFHEASFFFGGGTLSQRRSEIHREIRNDQIRPSAFDRGEDLVHHARAIDPAALRGGLHHRVF